MLGRFQTKWNVRSVCNHGGIHEEWSEELIPNIFHDEGEEYLVKVAFTEETAVPANHYIGLDDRASLAEGDTLTTVNATEPSGNGYARVAVATDNVDYTATQPAGNWQVASKTVTFTASGGPIPAAGVVDNMFLCDQASGTAGDLYASVALSTSRTILDGDSLNVDITIEISE